MPIGAVQLRKRRDFVGTPCAYIVAEEKAKPESFAISSSDSEVFANTSLFAECLQLKMENAELKAENTALKEKVASMQANSAGELLEIREIPREQAKKEIKAYFEAHHGQNIYPSDLMDALRLDYNLVWELCNELEKEEKIKGL